MDIERRKDRTEQNRGGWRVGVKLQSTLFDKLLD